MILDRSPGPPMADFCDPLGVNFLPSAARSCVTYVCRNYCMFYYKTLGITKKTIDFVLAQYYAVSNLTRASGALNSKCTRSYKDFGGIRYHEIYLRWTEKIEAQQRTTQRSLR